MGREGPCFHCGIEQTPLWRTGPSGKPVLCNACGSRWRTRGTLDDYIPKHANREIQSYQLPSEMKPRLLARDDQKLEVGVEVAGQNGSSACLDKAMNNISSFGSAGSSSDNCMQMEETNDKYPLWNPDNVPRRKRSELRQHILSPVERLQRQLFNILQEPGSENIFADDDNIIIYGKTRNIPPNEIGLGAVLLVSPTTATERSTALSPMEEDNASSSMNVPHMDTTSRVSSQKLYSQRACCGAKIGCPVKRPRGRPRLSATQGAKVGLPVKRPRGRPRLSTTQGRYLDKDGRSQTADDSLQPWSSSLIDVPIYSVNLDDSTGTSATKGWKVDTLTVNMENNLNEHIMEDQTQTQRLEPQMAKMGTGCAFQKTSDEKQRTS